MIPEQHKRKAAATALAVAIAAPMEGLRQVAYYDPPGILTVCRGHTGPDVVKNKRYSLQECDALFDADMRVAIDEVDRCRPGLPVEILASFADAVYNSGPKIACDDIHSTASRMLRDKRYAEACEQHLRWNRATVAGVSVALPGLTKRTILRRDLCVQGLT